MRAAWEGKRSVACASLARALPFTVAALAWACAPSPPRSFPLVPVVTDTVWYVSARARVDGRDSRRLADSLEYGYVVYARQRVDVSITGTVRIALADSVRQTRKAFVASLRERTGSAAETDDFAVLYIHGFGTSLREAWEHTAQARIRSRSRAPWIVFCWPSNGTGMSWPRPGAIFVRAYREDSVAAAASRPAFAEATRAVLEGVGGARLLLAAHSLGSQLVGEALAEDLSLRIALGADPLRSIAFLAPDVEARRFADYLVPAVTPLARRVVLYTSSRDRVLMVARQVHHSDRAGLGRPRALVRPGLETVDVTRGVVAESWLQRVFGTHHALRRAAAALYDLVQLVGAGFAASCRAAIGTAFIDADGAWHLTRAYPPPGDSIPRRCTDPI